MKKVFSKTIGPLSTVLLVVLMAGCSTTMRLRSTYHPLLPNAQEAREWLKNIRVAIAKHCQEALILSDAPVSVYDMNTRQKLMTLDTALEPRWSLKGRHLWTGSHLYSAAEIRLVPLAGHYLSVNGVPYRGQLSLLPNSENGLTVINILPLDDYLQGVVPNEMRAQWPLEALKAQALAARSFAVYKMSGRRNADFDLDATVNSQVYRGMASEQASTNEAVQQTHNLIVAYQQQVIAAFYHSNCGGHTADVRDVWGGNYAYLQGVACTYCRQGPHFTWSFDLSKSQMQKLFTRYHQDCRDIKNVRILSRDHSGRVQKLQIRHSGGSFEMQGAAFRMMVGADKIRSTHFDLSDQGPVLHFTGQGWGHGVGLCQEGAKGMAEQGARAEAIIRYYYPGTILVSLGL